MIGKEDIGTILRWAFGAEKAVTRIHKPSKNLKQALTRLDCETDKIKEDAATQTNTAILSQMLEKIR